MVLWGKDTKKSEKRIVNSEKFASAIRNFSVPLAGNTKIILLFPVGEVHTKEDESGAEEKPDGNLLVEQPPGEEDGGDGIEVDPVRRDDRTELADDPVPDEVTKHRGDDSQEEKIQNG